MRTNHFQIRILNNQNPSFGITIPHKIAIQNLGIFFYIEQFGNEIILKSGCQPKEVMNDKRKNLTFI